MNLELVDSQLLKSKFDGIYLQIHTLCKEVGPKIEQIGKLREQAQIFYNELEKRGEAPKYEPPLGENK